MTKHGRVQCIAGHETVFRSKDYNLEADIFSASIWNQETGPKLEHMELEVPERAEYIRVILAELDRVASHMLFYGVYGLDLGAITPVLYGFRERERIQALFETITGARMMHNYIRVGGVKNELPDDFERRLAELMGQLDAGIEECDKLLSGDEMFLARTKGIG